MKVFKFGGASVKDTDAIRNVANIIRTYSEKPLTIVISAAGKTTNALESVVNAHYNEQGTELQLLQGIKDFHYKLAETLCEEGHQSTCVKLDKVFDRIETWLSQPPAENYDFFYDQIVSAGELLSTIIVSDFLNRMELKNNWVDARRLIRTNNTYREAKIDWQLTPQKIREKVLPILDEHHVITQGFIGGTSEGFTTTLGREGSDFTASIFAYSLNAEGVYIWKDVPGVLNADPRLFKTVSKLDFLTYRDAIEMTYYGAQVIHPKTIKPLQNKGIPLYVRSFLKPDGEGTAIHDNLEYSFIPPVIVIKPNQVLLNISTKDFSFIAEDNLSKIYSIFARYRVRVNMTQNSAISFIACFDYHPQKMNNLIEELKEDFDVQVQEGLKLVTLKHYNESVMAEIKSGYEVILEGKIKDAAQLLLKEQV